MALAEWRTCADVEQGRQGITTLASLHLVSRLLVSCQHLQNSQLLAPVGEALGCRQDVYTCMLPSISCDSSPARTRRLQRIVHRIACHPAALEFPAQRSVERAGEGLGPGARQPCAWPEVHAPRGGAERRPAAVQWPFRHKLPLQKAGTACLSAAGCWKAGAVGRSPWAARSAVRGGSRRHCPWPSRA